MPVCVNKGCNRTFEAGDGTECTYHPGAPIFHEGLKGWACCAKRVTDFDAFLKIPGCTTGEHSAVARAPEVAPPMAAAPAAAPTETTPVANDNSQPAATAPESFDATATKPRPAAAPPKPAEDEFPADPADALVPEGTVCRRRGCGAKYDGQRGATCTFHPGTPIFHEGSKGWSCCRRKVLEFSEFLKICGCTSVPEHVFCAPLADTANKDPELRTDWYQTRDSIVLSLYAKRADQAQSKVDLDDNGVRARLVTPQGDLLGVLALATYEQIAPSASTIEFLSTKVEIILKKRSGISWPQLERGDGSMPASWTTFGASHGHGGTIGAKKMDLATDAPIYAARNTA